MTHSATPDIFADWLAALEARHLADLRVPEVTRALRALSSAYVQRRHKVAAGATLDTAGKRAAFALFYGPLHFLTIARVADALGARRRAPSDVIDLGCGTGVAGAAWALAAGGEPLVSGVDRHPWAVEEARWTYRQLRLRGRARIGDVARHTVSPSATTDIVAAYTMNELPERGRLDLEPHLLRAAAAGSRVLIVEPISKAISPWWDSTAARVVAQGGRADEWRFPADLPPLVRLLDKAAGLNHHELTARTLFLG